MLVAQCRGGDRNFAVRYVVGIARLDFSQSARGIEVCARYLPNPFVSFIVLFTVWGGVELASTLMAGGSLSPDVRGGIAMIVAASATRTPLRVPRIMASSPWR